jgi:hypothetical protein
LLALLAFGCKRGTTDPAPALIHAPEAASEHNANPRATAARWVGSAEARRTSIRRTADRIRSECERAAGGDWERWQSQTASYRAALAGRIASLQRSKLPRGLLHPQALYEPLAGSENFPLFEIAAGDNLRYLTEQQPMSENIVAAANRWLQKQGIDLVLVPAPKMTEVYIDRFIDPAPADGVIAPHVRKAMLTLLEDDVDVLDVFRLFRTQSGQQRLPYLYNTCDLHWAPYGMGVAAHALAELLTRYPAVCGWRKEPARFMRVSTPYMLNAWRGGIGAQDSWPALSPDQQALATKWQEMNSLAVRLPDGSPAPGDTDSPILLIGNSFVPYFQDRVMDELNMPVRVRWGGGHTTEAFRDFLRQPELLKGVKLVVWVVTEYYMTKFSPLPDAIATTSSDRK